MLDFAIIEKLGLSLLVSLPVLYGCKLLKLSSIVGFIITGILVGPEVLGIFSSQQDIHILAEIGVIMLMFTIGLEFSIEKLLSMRKILFAMGGSQMLLTTIIVSTTALALTLPITESIFLGLLISYSSTAIVMSILVERSEITSIHGKLSVAVSLFQDVMLIPILLLLPVLDTNNTLSLEQIGLRIGLTALVLVGVFYLARFLIPKLLYFVATFRMREVFTVTIVLLVLGIPLLTDHFGLGLTIGAFIAGVIISESDFNYQVISEIVPIKDIFNSIFFLSIGLLVVLSQVFESLGLVLLVATVILIGKATIVFVIAYLMGYNERSSFLTGVLISQVGELAFVLLPLGLAVGAITSQTQIIFTASTVISMVVTPVFFTYAISLSGKIAIQRKSKISETSTDIPIASLNEHVIIVGYGLNGKNVSTVLKETGIPYIVIELNPETVKRFKESGENIVYGDVTKKEILAKANVFKAKVIIFGISDSEGTRLALRLCKEMNPNIFAIVRTRFVKEVEGLVKLGADEVIPEEFETSLQIFSKALSRYHIPINIIMQQVSLLRGESYSILRNAGDPAHRLAHIDEILAQGLTETFYVTESNANIGKTLIELHLRNKTGATIIAIVRKNTVITNPSGNDEIALGDTIVITGNHAAVDAAIELLSITNSENE